MKKYKYGVVARFAIGKNVFGGQTIKTRNFTDELENHVGKENVFRGDTSGWQKKPLRLIKNLLYSVKNCEELVILPADHGVLVIPQLAMLLRGFRKTKLQYVVIGGWLPEFLEKRKVLSKCLKKFDGIYVETQTMKNALDKQGFENIVVLPNFKQIHVLNENELVYSENEPYKLCTFSRVLKEKGIEDAANAVKAINEKAGRTIYTLDIYGKVDASYEEDFEIFCKNMPEYVRYMGQVDGSKSTEIIKDYFALLFPTYFYGEGYPGTLLDAFSAGVPAIASDWRYNSEIIGSDKGFLHQPNNVEDLSALLLDLSKDPEKLNSKKTACLDYANTMRPEKLITIFAK